MNLYLDASVLIPMFVTEARTEDANAALVGNILTVSNFAASEFSSGVARLTRMGNMSTGQAASVFATFDAWIARAARHETVTSKDIATAQGFVRRIDLALRAPDALNIAIAQRCGATLFTFDIKMAVAARALSLDVLPIALAPSRQPPP